jgi:hypothetical protein
MENETVATVFVPNLAGCPLSRLTPAMLSCLQSTEGVICTVMERSEPPDVLDVTQL